MYQAIPYSSSRPWPRPPPKNAAAVKKELMAPVPSASTSTSPAPTSSSQAKEEAGGVKRAVAESPVVVVGRRGCCLSHVVKRLLQGQGVNPATYEVADEAAIADIAGVGGGAVQLPAVFVGGKLLGGLDRLMAVHISGELVPILKEAGALWL